MQSPGLYISGAAHVGLIVWLIAGWGFAADPLDFEIADVSVVSSEDFAALVAATTPDPGDADPDAPVAPTEDAAPTLAPVEETPPPPAPEAVEPPAEDQAPPDAPEPPAPPVETQDTPPEIAPPAEEQAAIPEPITTEPPQSRPAERIAPEPVAPPPPDTDTAPEVQEAASPDAAPNAPEVSEPEETAAPEETATEIAPEDAAPSGAVQTSLRPVVRPNRPAPEPEPEVETASDLPAAPSADEDAIAAALEAAQASDAPDVPRGDPMTASEREGFRVAVNECWVVDPGSQSANVIITVAFSLNQQGQVQGDIRQIGAQGGSAAAVENAFQKARRAILRCQKGGYQLPVEKYGQWQNVEITFDPTGMREL